jgi:hypothetical protein
MLKARSVLPLCLALCCLSAPPSATAATGGWMINHVQLTGSSKLATSFLTSPIHFNTPEIPLDLSCKSSTVDDSNFTINAPSDGKAEHFLFLGCEVSFPEGCTTNSAIATFPTLLTELTLEGTLAVKGEIKPTEKFGFAQVQVFGTSCAASGQYFIQGALGLLLPFGQDERTLQTLLISDAGKLTIGMHPATAHFTWLVGLSATNQTWSFL